MLLCLKCQKEFPAIKVFNGKNIRRKYNENKCWECIPYISKEDRIKNSIRYCSICKKQTKNPKYCSQSCAAIYINKHFIRKHGPCKSLTCKNCKEILSGNKTLYCSDECKFFKRFCKTCGIKINNEDVFKSYCSENCSKISIRKRNKRGYALNRVRRIKRYPKWLSENEKNKIKQFYNDCPEGMVVDHIIPLCGENVSGLHRLNNLQYLSKNENQKKNNKFESYIKYF